MRLEIELVPKTCWWSNVRSNITPSEWEKCKRFVKERSGDRCEICGGKGARWPVECHEIWDYTLEGPNLHIQRLVGLEALCPRCHEVKHIGRAIATGNGPRAIEHLARVNGISLEDSEEHAMEAYYVWEERSKHPWKLDVSFLALLGIDVPIVTDRDAT